MLTQEKLKNILQYESQTGIFTWAVNGRKKKIGSVAGTYIKSGYRRIHTNKKFYLAHRLAWLYVHGDWPENQIDHINGIRDDNRISNLRSVTNAENQQNRKSAYKNSQTGFLGVSRNKKRYTARIRLNGKMFCLGSFANPEDAHDAYLREKRKIHQAADFKQG